MSNISEAEKTQQATPKKRRDERKKGNIFLSRDITGALGLLGFFMILRFAAPLVYGYMGRLLKQYMVSFSGVSGIDQLSAKKYITDFVLNSLIISLPLIISAALLAIVFDSFQTRMNFSLDQVKPDFSRLSIAKGFKRIFNIRSLFELIKSIIKVVIIGAVLYTEIKANMHGFITMPYKSVSESLVFIADTVYRIMIKIGLLMLAFGVLDYFYQWLSYEKQIRMSVQEVKEEYKQTEGDPLIKSRQKDRQRRLSMLRIAQNVPHADVVVRNPTHYAVAIKYDQKKDNAPKVIAKGRDYLALKIVEIAEKNRITITENPPLARGLYESVEIEQEIPEKYYQAVAELLVFVYKKLR